MAAIGAQPAFRLLGARSRPGGRLPRREDAGGERDYRRPARVAAARRRPHRQPQRRALHPVGRQDARPDAGARGTVRALIHSRALRGAARDDVGRAAQPTCVSRHDRQSVTLPFLNRSITSAHTSSTDILPAVNVERECAGVGRNRERGVVAARVRRFALTYVLLPGGGRGGRCPGLGGAPSGRGWASTDAYIFFIYARNLADGPRLRLQRRRRSRRRLHVVPLGGDLRAGVPHHLEAARTPARAQHRPGRAQRAPSSS